MDYTQCTPTPRKNKHLSLTEWIKIEIMLQEGKTAYAIAKSMQRSINTILHEIRCGSVDQIKAGKKIRIYLADAGQALRFYEFYISRRYIKIGEIGAREATDWNSNRKNPSVFLRKDLVGFLSNRRWNQFSQIRWSHL